MIWALGFHADPTGYAPGVKVSYDRHIFTEFNSRQPVRTTFTMLGFMPAIGKRPTAHRVFAQMAAGGGWCYPDGDYA